MNNLNELISQLSAWQIIFIIFIVGLALKEIVTLVQFFVDIVRKKFDKEYAKSKDRDTIQIRLDANERNLEKQLEAINALKVSIDDWMANAEELLKEQQDKIDLLIKSDKDDIKSFIVREYHFFVEKQGWIDDFSMDAISKRYEHYVEEHGNSYVESLMHELRKLPKHPPINK